MEFFYTVVIIVAIVFFVVILTLVGLTITSPPTNKNFPPSQNTCPDYWTANPPCDPLTNTNCCPASSTACCGINPINVGNSTQNLDLTYSFTSFLQPAGTSYMGNTVIDFGDPKWQTQYALTAKCALKKWANLNDVQWDGVSNFNGC